MNEARRFKALNMNRDSDNFAQPIDVDFIVKGETLRITAQGFDVVIANPQELRLWLQLVTVDQQPGAVFEKMRQELADQLKKINP